MKINFKNIEIVNIEGKKETLSNDYKNMANMMYSNARDLEGVETARTIFHDGEVELTKDNAPLLRDFINTYFIPYIIKNPILEKIDEFIKNNKEE